MAETNGSGGYINERMDRAEAMLNQVASDHVLFLQDHQMLLRAQVARQDSLEKLDKKIDRLVDSQGATDERLNALIGIVDGWIRANPRPSL